jgi:nitrate reductase delta subunit
VIPPVDAWDRLADALEYPHVAPPALQERYTATFDLNPSCTLDIGWHLFGETPERGGFLARLRDDLARAGIDERGDLPDYLPTLVRLIGHTDGESAVALATLIAPAVLRIRDVLTAEQNPFADLIDAVARLLEARCRNEERP